MKLQSKLSCEGGVTQKWCHLEGGFRKSYFGWQEGGGGQKSQKNEWHKK